MRHAIVFVTALAALAGSALAQNRGGRYAALDYAFGQVQTDRPIILDGGPYTSGTGVVFTVRQCAVPALDGNQFCPLAINNPIQVGSGGDIETVTPTAVSCSTPLLIDTCTFTATTSNNHTAGEYVKSSTYGLQEAANYAMSNGGGFVVVSPAWATAGGATSTITSASLSGTYSGLGSQGGFAPDVYVEDLRTNPPGYWWIRPGTTLISAGAAVVLTQSAGGSLTSTGTYYYSYEFVDAMGGISLPATDSAQLTLTGSNAQFTAAAPVATTGAVGYIPMVTASAGSTGTEIEVPVTSSVCTLATTLSATGKPICAMTSTALVAANPSSTAKEVVEGSAHTTILIGRFTRVPPPLQVQFGPFVATGTLNNSNADAAQFYTPAGYLNYLGKTFEVCVKGATATQVASSVLNLNLEASTQYAQSPVTLSTITFPTQTQAAAGTFGGCWIVSTQVTGSSGKFWTNTPNPFYNSLNTAPGTEVVATDVTTAASSAIDLTKGLYWSVNLQESASHNITSPIINNLTITELN